jgi:hypothetical protein
MEPNLSIAHIKDEDGKIYQVLNEDGTDWDETATRALYEFDNPTKLSETKTTIVEVQEEPLNE